MPLTYQSKYLAAYYTQRHSDTAEIVENFITKRTSGICAFNGELIHFRREGERESYMCGVSIGRNKQSQGKVRQPTDIYVGTCRYLT